MLQMRLPLLVMKMAHLHLRWERLLRSNQMLTQANLKGETQRLGLALGGVELTMRSCVLLCVA